MAWLFDVVVATCSFVAFSCTVVVLGMPHAACLLVEVTNVPVAGKIDRLPVFFFAASDRDSVRGAGMRHVEFRLLKCCLRRVRNLSQASGGGFAVDGVHYNNR